MIVIVDYGMGNLGSIFNMLKKIGAEAKIASDPKEIEAARKLVLPGVGAFDTAMRNLRETGLKDVLDRCVLEKRIPTLGVCLGMQLLTGGSEEGDLPGLGWVPGTTKRFRFEPGSANAELKVPHMGWNTITLRAEGGAKSLTAGLNDPPSRFYFVHSYYVTVDDPAHAAATTHYGHDFVSMVQKDHVMGTQFHPEKSHKFGMKVLRNFAEVA